MNFVRMMCVPSCRYDTHLIMFDFHLQASSLLVFSCLGLAGAKLGSDIHSLIMLRLFFAKGASHARTKITNQNW